MSVLNPERGIAPRSAQRYHPIGTGQASGPGPVLTRKPPRRTDTRSSSAQVVPDDLDLEEEEEHVSPRRRSVPPAPRRTTAPPARARSRVHPLLWLGVGLLAVILLWIAVSQVIAWGTGVLDLLHYGNPRTYQVDAVVGQGDGPSNPSHFIALNLHGQIIILDFLAGESKAREFIVSSILAPNADQVVITLRFLDVDHNGRPDMIIDAGGAQAFLVNADGTFRPPTPAEQQQILRALSL